MFIFHVIGSLFNSNEPQGFGYSQIPQCQDKINCVEALRLKCHSLYDNSLAEWERQSKEYYTAKQEFVAIMGNSSVTYNNPVTYISH